MSIPITRMSELSTGAQLVLWAARHVVAAALRGSGVPWCVERSFEIAGAVSAYEELQALILALARSTPRQLTVHRPSCGALTADEVSLLAALVGDHGQDEPGQPLQRDDMLFSGNVARCVQRLREGMALAGLPLSRLGMPDARHLAAGRAPALHANPGLAGVH